MRMGDLGGVTHAEISMPDGTVVSECVMNYGTIEGTNIVMIETYDKKYYTDWSRVVLTGKSSYSKYR